MPRVMIDTTHDGLPASLPAIRALPAGSLVALYVTGSPGVVATPADWAEIPAHLTRIKIDQGFTGSPQLDANERDCETGAWSLSRAVNRAGWNVARPTLYLGYPDTLQAAHDAGWRGDVRVALASADAPASPPPAPPGINVVAVQWDFSNPNYDRSVVFDPYWPEVKPVTTPTAQVPPGPWLDPKKWNWQEAVIIGRGENNNLDEFAYNPATGEWVRVSLPGQPQI